MAFHEASFKGHGNDENKNQTIFQWISSDPIFIYRLTKELFSIIHSRAMKLITAQKGALLSVSIFWELLDYYWLVLQNSIR